MNKQQGLALAVAAAIALAAMVFWPATSVAPQAPVASVKAPEEEEEEGVLVLNEQQIQAAGIQLAKAQPRQISTLLSLPGTASASR